MQATVKIIQDYYQAFNEKAYQKMLNLLSEDIIHDTNQGSRSHGKEAFAQFLKEMDTYYDENLTDIVIMLDSTGTRASAEFICHGTYKTTCEGLPEAHGQQYHLPVGCFFEVEGNKIKRITNYYNLGDWLTQVK